jgi:NAD(P)-dependent dehydrogenase (short-subunit alcohol dehydrogenase family)
MSDTQRCVIVTGAGGGIGGAAVRQIAARGGVNVTAVDRSAEGLERLVAKLGDASAVVPVSADVSSSADVQRLIEHTIGRWGRLDGIYNVAGIPGRPVDIVDLSDDEYDEVMAVNARSVWLGMKYALPHLVKSGAGAIVNTGSYYAVRGGAAFVAYAGSKHAVVGMTKSVALAYAKHSVRANVVLPGPTDTRMIEQAFDGLSPQDRDEGERALLATLPTSRLSTPDEVASAGVWALLDAPMHFSGQVLPVDGALSAG